MKKDPKIFLEHILDSIGAIEEYTKNIGEDEFCAARKTVDAVVRNIEIIGEAVKNLSTGFKNKAPHIPWKKIAGMRDNLIHEYFGVNKSLVWEVVKKDLPELKKEIELLLK